MVESFESFKANYDKNHPLAAVFNKMSPLSDFEMHHEYYVQMLYNGETVDLTKYKNELKKHVHTFISEELEYGEQMDYNRFHECMLMLQKAGASKEELEKVDSVFLNMILKFLRKDLNYGFSVFWDNNLTYLIARENYYRDIRIGTTEDELHFQSVVFANHRCDFNKVIEESYVMFLKWVQQCYYYYRRRPDLCEKEYQYASFIEEITALCVSCCRNNCDFDSMSEYILFRERFKTKNEKKKLKKFVRTVIDWVSGYGERPLRLLTCFGILSIIFTLTYFFLPGINGLPEGVIDRVIASVYFYITTCLTVGYGEIHPSSSCAMIVVMINEILGFVIGGSFISLYLRKIFRY